MRNFGEKEKEWSAKQGKYIPVWKSPKYEESKEMANRLLDSGDYDLKESDFWILMNETKSGKMGYTGLIISHNGCLKINDGLPETLRYKPSCATAPEVGYRDSLVMRYINDNQGIYEIGEVSGANCKNDYPFAMVLKRLFDRVVLKNSKIAYAGIYSDSEADEFRYQPDKEEKPEEKAMEYQLEIIRRYYTGANMEKLLTTNKINKLEDLPALTAARIIGKLNRGEGIDG